MWRVCSIRLMGRGPAGLRNLLMGRDAAWGWAADRRPIKLF